MEQGFPSDPLWRAVYVGTISLHSIMLILVGGSTVWRSRQPPRKRDAWLWTIGCLVSPGLILLAIEAWFLSYASIDSRFFVLGYVIFVGVMCSLGTLVSHVRLSRAGRASYATVVVLGLFGFIGIAIALSPATLIASKESVTGSQCTRNLRSIRDGLNGFESSHKVLPRAATGSPPLSWRVAILPFMEEDQLFRQFDQTTAWDDLKNAAVAQTAYSRLMCRARESDRHDSQHRYFTDYVMPTGPRTVSPNDRGVGHRDFTDGGANTALIVEATGLNIVWTEPRDFDTVHQPIGINLKGKVPTESPGMLSSYHRGGAHMLMGDGRARFINEKIAPQILKQLSTIDGRAKIYED